MIRINYDVFMLICSKCTAQNCCCAGVVLPAGYGSLQPHKYLTRGASFDFVGAPLAV